MTFLILFYLQMRGFAKEYLVDIVAKFEPCPENLQRTVLGIDGMRELANQCINNITSVTISIQIIHPL